MKFRSYVKIDAALHKVVDYTMRKLFQPYSIPDSTCALLLSSAVEICQIRDYNSNRPPAMIAEVVATFEETMSVLNATVAVRF